MATEITEGSLVHLFALKSDDDLNGARAVVVGAPSPGGRWPVRLVSAWHERPPAYCTFEELRSRHNNVLLIKHESLIPVEQIHARGSPELAVYAAAEAGDAATLEALLLAGACTCRRVAQQPWGSAAHVAARNGHADCLSLLARHGADVNAIDNGRLTPLSYALEYSHTHCVMLLLQLGSNPNVCSRRLDSTPLHWAANEGQLAATRWLTLYGADLNAQEAKGGEMFAALRGMPRPPHDSGGGPTPLMLAAGEGHLGVIKVLASAGADLEAADAGGVTALMYTLSDGPPEVATLLIALGASVFLPGSDLPRLSKADLKRTLLRGGNPGNVVLSGSAQLFPAALERARRRLASLTDRPNLAERLGLYAASGAAPAPTHCLEGVRAAALLAPRSTGRFSMYEIEEALAGGEECVEAWAVEAWDAVLERAYAVALRVARAVAAEAVVQALRALPSSSLVAAETPSDCSGEDGGSAAASAAASRRVEMARYAAVRCVGKLGMLIAAEAAQGARVEAAAKALRSAQAQAAHVVGRLEALTELVDDGVLFVG